MQYDKIDVMYMRLSLEDGDVASGKAEESCSIGSQRKCIEEYINRNAELPTDFTEYVDDGFSGTNMERPAMSRILQLVALGRVRTIIVRDLSRFARNYLEAGHYLEYIFPAYDVRFISINDHYDSAKIAPGNDGAFQLAIRNLLNDLYSKDISRKIKTAVDIKKLNGEYVYGQAPYGYKKGLEKNTIVIDDNVAPVVERIFTMAASGITVTEIAKTLNKEEILTPSVYLKDIRGKYKTYPFWSFESVKNIITNRIYTGDTVPFRSRVKKIGSNNVNFIPEEEQIVIPDTHEAIVSRELFYNARKVIKSNKKSKTNKQQPLLSGYLVCACCGNKLAKGRTTNKYWLCPSARYSEGRECHDIRLEEAEMEKNLLHAVRMQCDLAAVEAKELINKQNLLYNEVTELTNESKQIEGKLDLIASRLMSMLEDYYAEKISKEEFLQLKKSLKDDEEKLFQRKQEVAAKIQSIKQPIRHQNDKKDNMQVLTKHIGIEKLDTLIMKELIKNIVVYPNNAVKINWNFKNDLIS